jgi:hypothetical protein
VQSLLTQLPRTGANTALVGHIFFPVACGVLNSLEPGEAAIYRPDGFGGTELVARVGPFAWDDLE